MPTGNVAPSDWYCTASNVTIPDVPLEEDCNTQACPPLQYVTTAVGDCSAPCYKDPKVLPFVRVNISCYSLGVPVAMSVCEADPTLKKPNNTRVCNYGPLSRLSLSDRADWMH